VIIKFEEECRKRNIRLFILPLNSPELDGYIERAHLTHTEESYEVVDSSFHIPELRNDLLGWEEVSRYNRDMIEEVVLPVIKYGVIYYARESPREILAL
jgi:hypothetical protein